MDPLNLSSCLVHNGTIANPRDIIRAVETLEGIGYRQMVDGEVMAEGTATLVKIMAEPDSSTILVNGCLFLNVLSFRYLNFSTDAAGQCTFELVGDGMTLVLVPVDEPEGTEAPRVSARLMEAEAYGPGSFVILDDEDDEER
jgi:hypothetical protein